MFGALAVVSLGLKSINLGADPRVDKPRFTAALATHLRPAGFAVRLEGMDGSPRLIAARGECRVKAREYPPHGTQRDALVELGRAIGPTRYVYRGEWSETPPKLRPLLAFYVTRELARVGLDVSRRPIVAVAIAPACPPLSASWFDAPIGFSTAPRMRHSERIRGS